MDRIINLAYCEHHQIDSDVLNKMLEQVGDPIEFDSSTEYLIASTKDCPIAASVVHDAIYVINELRECELIEPDLGYRDKHLNAVVSDYYDNCYGLDIMEDISYIHHSYGDMTVDFKLANWEHITLRLHLDT